MRLSGILPASVLILFLATPAVARYAFGYARGMLHDISGLSAKV